MPNRFRIFNRGYVNPPVLAGPLFLPLLLLREKVGMRGRAAERRHERLPLTLTLSREGRGDEESAAWAWPSDPAFSRNGKPPALAGGVFTFFIFALFFVPGLALAAAPLSASHAWIRWLPGQTPLAGYVTFHNSSARAITLIDASSPAFKNVELHRSMTMKNGMETMKPVAAVTIPAGGKFSFAPGGYHLMIWRKQPIKVGDKLPIVFEFKNGGHLRVVFIVKGPTQ